MTYGSNKSMQWRAALCALLCAPACLITLPAHAFLLQGEALDTAASVLAIVVLCIVPVVGIAAFWMVHVLPEKIAHKRHHPQTRRDPHAVYFVVGVRRVALAARVPVGLLEAGDVQACLRPGQAR